ncbi:hypothetical protein Tco_0676117 [Tanacetum coccineum]
MPIWHSYSSTNTSASKSDNKRGGPREEEQVFLDDLARLQMQEKEANEEAEALRKNLEQETENLVLSRSLLKSSSTNIFSTVSTTAKASGTNLVNTVSIPVSTASPNKGLSLSDTTNSQEDDSEIPPLEDIHQDTTEGIFTHSSYDDEGAEADFTNLETVVNVSPIPTSRINPSHPSALILGDPTSAVQTRSKVNKSSEAHAFIDEEVICVDKPPGFLDPKVFTDKFYKVVKARMVTSKPPDQCSAYWMISSFGSTKNLEISNVAEILKKFDFASVKTASTPIETQKPLVKDEEDQVPKGKPKLGIGILECLHFDLETSQLVINTGANHDYEIPQQEVVNTWQFKTSLLGNAKSKPLWPLLLQKPNMLLLLQAAVGKIQYIIRETKHIASRSPTTSYEMLIEKKLIQVQSQAKIQTLDELRSTSSRSKSQLSSNITKAYLEHCLITQRFPGRLLKETKGQRVVNQTREKIAQIPDFEKFSTDRPIVSTDGSKVSTDEQVEGTEEHNEGTEEKNEGTEEIFEGTEEQEQVLNRNVKVLLAIKGTEDQTKEEIATQASQTSTQTPTSMIIGDDETIATLLLNMSQAKAASKEKEKGVELKDVEEIDRPRPTSTRSLLTLKPLPKIDPKDKGKKED